MYNDDSPQPYLFEVLWYERFFFDYCFVFMCICLLHLSVESMLFPAYVFPLALPSRSGFVRSLLHWFYLPTTLPLRYCICTYKKRIVLIL